MKDEYVRLAWGQIAVVYALIVLCGLAIIVGAIPALIVLLVLWVWSSKRRFAIGMFIVLAVAVVVRVMV